MGTSKWDIYIGDRLAFTNTVEHFCRELSSSYGTQPIRVAVDKQMYSMVREEMGATSSPQYTLIQALDDQWFINNTHLLRLEVFFGAQIAAPQYVALITAFLKNTYDVTLVQKTLSVQGMFQSKLIAGYTLSGDVRVWPAFYWGAYLFRIAEFITTQDEPTIQSMLDSNVAWIDDDGGDAGTTAEETVASYKILLEGKEPPADILFALNVGPIYGYELCSEHKIPYYAIRTLFQTKQHVALFNKLKERVNEISL